MTENLSTSSVEELLRQYAAILAELRRRGVVRTGNAPLGDYAEGLVADVYGGVLQPNSNKAFDVLTADGRRLQVKARLLGEGEVVKGQVTMFRSFDFDAAVILAFGRATYALAWAREVEPEVLHEHARYSAHTNAHLVTLHKTKTLGVDVTDRFRGSAGSPGYRPGRPTGVGPA